MERVLILRGAELLREIGPRHLIGLADVAREIEIVRDEAIYTEDDPSDALYIVVEGRVRLSRGEQAMSEVGPGQAFGTWSLVDDSARGHRAVCVEDGMTLAVHRDEFYDLAAGDLTLLTELVRALAKRLRVLVAERPEEARIEGEGLDMPDAPVPAPAATSSTAPSPEAAADVAQPSAAGSALTAAALGHPVPETDVSASPLQHGESASPAPDRTVEPPPR